MCVKKRILKFIRNEKYEKYKELKIKKYSWGWKLDQWLSITYKIEFGVFWVLIEVWIKEEIEEKGLNWFNLVKMERN